MTEAIYPSSLAIDHVHWPLWYHHAQIMGLETEAACYSGNDFENKKVFFLPVKCKVDKYGLHKSITTLNKKSCQILNNLRSYIINRNIIYKHD